MASNKIAGTDLPTRAERKLKEKWQYARGYISVVGNSVMLSNLPLVVTGGFNPQTTEDRKKLLTSIREHPEKYSGIATVYGSLAEDGKRFELYGIRLGRGGE
ncbi:MAG: hypothetical protein IT384_08895 [Deltaproteobacteria bacterium]|nr:hypothetical protein [Deltaproteobacteria bacterium]